MGYSLRRIDKAAEEAEIIDAEMYPGIVFFSDCHRGCGTWNDSFLRNKTIYQAALNHYRKSGYAYVELGDGDELWENRCFESIAEIHKDVFEILSQFERERRLFMIYGNHDKTRKKQSRCTSENLFSPKYNQSAVIELPDKKGSLYLMHGHQGDMLNDRLWPLARWMVRYLWRPLELCGFNDPTSAARNYKKSSAVEKRLIDWAKKNGSSIMTGHTHRPAMRKVDDIYYFNKGSCVHPNGITCIELSGKLFMLVKWTICADDNGFMYVCRQVMTAMDMQA